MRQRRAPGTDRNPSRRVLGRLPSRVVVFLHAIGKSQRLRAKMARGGYGSRDHAEGLALLQAVCAYGDERVEPFLVDDVARRAGATLESWVMDHFPRLEAAQARLHPAEPDLFAGIRAPAARRAILSLATLLDRLQHPRHAVVGATLAARGLDEAERQRLRALVKSATTPGLYPEQSRDGEDPARVSKASAAEPDMSARLVALYRWYQDWSATARAFVRRRGDLIQLGLATRQRGKGGAAG